MNKIELLTKVGNKEVDYFNLLNTFEFALEKLEHISNIIYTAQSLVSDMDGSDTQMNHLIKAKSSITDIQDTLSKAMYVASRNVSTSRIYPREYFYSIATFDPEQLLDSEEEFEIYIALMDAVREKTEIYDFMTFQLKKSTVKLSDTDILSVLIKSFLESLDELEESIYNAIQSRS